MITAFSKRLPASLFDFPLIIASMVLILTGLILIFDITPVISSKISQDSLFYFKNQLTWATLGTFSLITLSFFDYRRLIKLAPLIIFASIILLILVLIPHIGTQVNGARRWISFGAFNFQPSEFTKLSLVLYLTYIISKFEHFKIRLSDAMLVIFAPAILASLLVFLEPDLGTSLILLMIVLVTYFIGNGPILHFLLLFPALVLSVIPLIIFESYRLNRIKSFLDPLSDPLGSSYQIYQIIKALATGGLLGLGLGASRSKFNFIPEVQSDAIFAIFVEEVGFLGAVILIAVFVFFIRRILRIAVEAPDYQGKILASSIACLFAVQIFFNIGSNVAIIPLTGVPLPFISYGGSSLFVSMSAIGILLNIKRQS